MVIKPTITLPEIVSQLTTSWGGGDTSTYAWQGFPTITYGVTNTTPSNVDGYAPPEGGSFLAGMTANETAAANLDFQLWGDVISPSLVNTGSPAANITFNYSSGTWDDGTYTQTWATPTSTGNALTAAQIWIASDWPTNQDAAITPESYGNLTYLHEIGHALGLSHPGPYDDSSWVAPTYANDAVYSQDNRQYTVMSYFGGYDPASNGWTQDGNAPGWLYPDTPMVDDIAAAQSLYGVNTTTRSGDTVYGFNCNITGPEQQIFDFSLNPTPVYTIWDSGGTNTLDCSGYSGPQIIDLQPGTYSSVDGLTDNIGIAFGTNVQNAVGGAGDDIIYGNSLNNVIDGGGGTNTVVYSGAHTDYALQQLASGAIQVTDLRPGKPDGIDQDTNIQKFQFADGTFDASYLLSLGPPMTADYFHAVESVTGDSYYGVVYDNTGRYSVGSTVTAGPDQLGGQWTYTVDSIAAADGAHQGSSYNGMVYDYYYVDANLGASAYPYYGYNGFTGGPAQDTTFYSGSNYLGSDGDVVAFDGTEYAFGSNGSQVVADASLMKADKFTAVESSTGDTITGVVFDNTARYTVGSSVTNGLDQAGGHWTYTITGIASADAAHQDASYSGFQYDTSYYDADRQATYATLYGATGLNTGVDDRTANYSGNNYLGSDGDIALVDGTESSVASGRYVLADGPPMNADTFTAVESSTGDTITGVVFDNTARYTIGSSVTSGPDQAGGHWTYTITGITRADAAHQDATYSGFQYDTSYYDADRQATYVTQYGATGLNTGVDDRTANYSGNNYLGSDGDAVLVSGADYAIASGQYVVPDGLPGSVAPLKMSAATLGFSSSNASTGGDGVASANLTLLNNFAAASFTPTGSASTVASLANSSPEQPGLALPHA